MIDTIIQGDSKEVLKTLSDKSVNCIITSPPYWGLRDYGIEGIIWDGDPECLHNFNSDGAYHDNMRYRAGENTTVGNNLNPEIYTIKKTGGPNGKNDHNRFETTSQFCSLCGAWKGSLGLEPTFELYIKHLIQIFDECKRILRDDGTLWVNIGDTFSATRWSNTPSTTGISRTCSDVVLKKQTNLPAKSLCDIPFRFSIAMIDSGWIKRNTLIWHKPNCMPSSAKDRFTVDFEYVFFFTKSKRYWFERQFEPFAESTFERIKYPRGNENSKASKKIYGIQTMDYGDYSQGRNKRCVWSIATKPFSGAKILADYVGSDGKAYKVSLDCPIHGQRHGVKIHQKVECGEQLDQIYSHKFDNAIDRVQEPEGGSASIHSHNGDSHVNNASDHVQTSGNSHENRTFGLKDMVELQSNHGIGHTGQIFVSSSDYSHQRYFPIAIDHNKQKNKRVHVLETNLSYNVFDRTDSHIDDKLDKFQNVVLDHGIDESNTEVDSFSDVKDLSLSEETVYDKSYIQTLEITSNNNGNIKKCTCQVINTDHFATFPETLIEPMIKAGCPEGGLVMDPFMGAGTVAVVAKKLNRHYLGSELNQSYIEMAENRLKQPNKVKRIRQMYDSQPELELSLAGG